MQQLRFGGTVLGVASVMDVVEKIRGQNLELARGALLRYES